jgi:hypothetical protein
MGGRRHNHDSRIENLWSRAERADPTVTYGRNHIESLRHKELLVEPYSARRLFARMASAEISLFRGCSIPGRWGGVDTGVERALAALRARVPRGTSCRVWCGQAAWPRKLPFVELLDRWESARGVVNTTDLHIRGTQFERFVDHRSLTRFNLLPEAGEESKEVEILSLVISSSLSFTDSHTDAADGSNHCFVGEKLWLAWDRLEGERRGLEDGDRYTGERRQARFSVDDFLRLRSSRWFVVREGRTVFLPGNFVHKVVTLRPYIGIGCFYVALPNCLQTLTRWTVDDDVPPTLLNEVTSAALKRARALRPKSRSLQRAWGYEWMGRSLCHWRRRPRRQRDLMLADPRFRALVAIAEQKGNLT